jgi:hypothetical protein
MDAIEVIHDLILQTDKMLRLLKKKKASSQMESMEERAIYKEFVLSYFSKAHFLPSEFELDETTKISTNFDALLKITETRARVSRYLEILKEILKKLKNFRSRLLLTSSKKAKILPPDFSKLISDGRMKEILVNRWIEVEACLEGGSKLASLIMMGGLLEAIFLAKVMGLDQKDRALLFQLKEAPKDDMGKPAQLKMWGLNDFVQVSHVKGWITQTSKDLSEVVRDYRNYVHPQKEYSHGIVVTIDDCRVMWTVVGSLVAQLLKTK